MKQHQNISYRHIRLGFLCILGFVVFLFAGFWHSLFFLPAAFFLLGYILIDKKYLRCPHCGAFENLNTLFLAAKQTTHCHICGEIFPIESQKHR